MRPLLCKDRLERVLNWALKNDRRLPLTILYAANDKGLMLARWVRQ